MANNQKKWNAYIVTSNGGKFYLRQDLTTTEIINFLTNKCTIIGTNYFMYGMEVFCECV